MNILITGGHGFVGSYLAKQLLKDHHTVTIIDLLDKEIDVTKSIINIRSSPVLSKDSNHSYIMDTSDPHCERIFADHAFDAVYHFAYLDPTLYKDEMKTSTMHSNLAGLSQILHLSSAFKVKKVIVISQLNVYSESQKDQVAEQEQTVLQTELDNHHSLREKLCENYRCQGLDVLVLRTSNIYGSYYHRHNHFISRAIYASIAKHPLPIPDYKNFSANYLYIGDLADALVKILHHSTPDVLNLYGLESATEQHILDIINHIAQSDNVVDKKLCSVSEQNIFIPDSSLAYQILNWEPHTFLYQGLNETYAEANIRYLTQKQESNKNVTRRTDQNNHFSFKRQLAENLIIFIVSLLFSSIIYNNSGYNTDFLVFYVLISALIFHISQAIISLLLSISTHALFIMYSTQLHLIQLVQSRSFLLHMAILVLVTAIASLYSMTKTDQIHNLVDDLESTRDQLAFLDDLYDKSISLKKTLRSMVENNDENLSTMLSVINRLTACEMEVTNDEISAIFHEIFKAESVCVYHITGCYLNKDIKMRLVSRIGNQSRTATLSLNDHPYMVSALKNRQVYINRKLQLNEPMCCLPIHLNDEKSLIVFLDDIPFYLLTKHYTQSLQMMSTLLSHLLEARSRYEQSLVNSKKYSQTIYLNSKAFDIICSQKESICKKENIPYILVKVSSAESKSTSNISEITRFIRSTDIIGVRVDGSYDIILPCSNQSDYPLIKQRFQYYGYELSPLEIG